MSAQNVLALARREQEHASKEEKHRFHIGQHHRDMDPHSLYAGDTARCVQSFRLALSMIHSAQMAACDWCRLSSSEHDRIKMLRHIFAPKIKNLNQLSVSEKEDICARRIQVQPI